MSSGQWPIGISFFFGDAIQAFKDISNSLETCLSHDADEIFIFMKNEVISDGQEHKTSYR